MNVSRSSVVILALGTIILSIPQVLSYALIPQTLSDMFFGDQLWSYIGAIYIVTAVSYEIRDFISFRYTIGVAAAGVLIAILDRLISVSSSRPELAPPELIFVLFQKFVLIPLIVAFMAPLGRAENQKERLAVLIAVFAPFVVGLIRIGSQGFGFFFNLAMFSLMLATGGAVGFPLYLYASVHGPESSISDLGGSHS